MFTLHTNHDPEPGPARDGETTQFTAADENAPSLAHQRAHRRYRRGLARDLQRPARKESAA